MQRKLIALTLATAFSLPAAAASFTCDAWTVHGNNSLPALKITAGATDPAGEVAKAYEAAGIVSIRIEQAENLCAVKVHELRTKPTGPYAGYLPSGRLLTRDDLAVAGNRISAEATLRNQSAKISLGAIDLVAGTIELVTTAESAPNPSARGASFSLGNAGSRYTSAEVATVSAFTNVPDAGMKLEASVSAGIPGLHKESKGGSYNAVTLRATKPTELAEFSLEATQTGYGVGGQYKDFDVTGGNTRVTAGALRLLTPALAAEVKAGYVSSKSEIGALDSGTKTSYGTGYAGVRYSTSTPEVDVAVTAGALAVAGAKTETSGPVTLARDAKSSSTAARADAALVWRLPAEISTAFARAIRFAGSGQVASKYLPEPEQFYIGGMDRGSASPNGQFAGPSGVSGSVRVLGEQLTVIDEIKLTPFLGVNGGRVKPVVGDAKRTAAFELGVMATGIGPDAMSAQVSVSKPLIREGLEDSARVNFSLNIPF